jgi:hypothetical protein
MGEVLARQGCVVAPQFSVSYVPQSRLTWSSHNQDGPQVINWNDHPKTDRINNGNYPKLCLPSIEVNYLDITMASLVLMAIIQTYTLWSISSFLTHPIAKVSWTMSKPNTFPEIQSYPENASTRHFFWHNWSGSLDLYKSVHPIMPVLRFTYVYMYMYIYICMYTPRFMCI